MRWFFYNIFFAVGYTLMTPRFLLRMRRRGGYGPHFRQRFGRYEPDVRARLGSGGAVWVHAVSVGEVYVAGRLMRALRERSPGIRFVLSTTSSTGRREAVKQTGPEDVLLYNPLDFPGCVRRALDAIRPRACLVVETEIWPNMIRGCARRGIPLFLVNGRVSDGSAPGYRRLRFWFGPVLRQFELLMVQSGLDARRLREAGADPARIEVTGSFKFDVAERQPERERQAGELLARLGFGPDRLLLLGGSTWEGEEETLLGICRALQPRFPGLRLILAPRHFERGEAVVAAIEAAGFRAVRKSRLDSGATPAGPLTAGDVLLLDTTGDLAGFYPHATVAFVGKSLAARGGQNMIEPCLCGVPTLVGPHTQNFRPVMADLLAARAIIQVPDAESLGRETARLLASPEARRELGQRALATVRQRRGATERCATRLLAALERAGTRG